MAEKTYELSDIFEVIVEKKYLISIICLSIFVNSFYLQVQSFWPDESLYLWLAQEPLKALSQIIALSSYVPSFIMSSLTLLFGSVLAGKATIILFSILGAVFTYFLGKEIFKEEIYGFFSSLLLILNPYYLFLGTRVLLDVPIASAVVIQAYFLLRFEKNRNRKNALLAGFTSALPFLIKLPGLVSLLIPPAYFLFHYKKKFFDLFKDKNFLIYLGTLSGIFILFVLTNFFVFGNILPKPASGYMAEHIYGGDWNYYLINMPNLFSPMPIVVFLLGLALMIMNLEEKSNKIILFSGLIYFFFFSFIIGEKVPRYLLPFFPFFFIVLSYGLSLIKYKKFPLKYIFAILILFFAYDYISSAHALTISRTESYMGYPQTGQWISNYATGNDIIYTGAYRSIRAFSGFDLEEDGGNIRKIPKNWTQFLSEINSTNRTIILETDTWEYTQPDWIYPITQEKYTNLTALNFTLYYIYPEEQPKVFVFVKHT